MLTKPEARQRAAGAVSRLVGTLRDRLLGARGEQAPGPPLHTYQATAAGDVDSDDPAGSWADDGGGGHGGGQASPVRGSAPLAPET
jgi:hypothetical protein